MRRRQESTPPQPRIQRLSAFALRRQHTESRQIFVFTSQTITEPRPQRGSPRNLGTGHKKRDGWIVVDGFGVKGFDEAQFIRHSGGMGQQFADPMTGRPMTGKFESRARQRQGRLVGGHPG